MKKKTKKWLLPAAVVGAVVAFFAFGKDAKAAPLPPTPIPPPGPRPPTPPPGPTPPSPNLGDPRAALFAMGFGPSFDGGKTDAGPAAMSTTNMIFAFQGVHPSLAATGNLDAKTALLIQAEQARGFRCGEAGCNMSPLG